MGQEIDTLANDTTQPHLLQEAQHRSAAPRQGIAHPERRPRTVCMCRTRSRVPAGGAAAVGVCSAVGQDEDEGAENVVEADVGAGASLICVAALPCRFSCPRGRAACARGQKQNFQGRSSRILRIKPWGNGQMAAAMRELAVCGGGERGRGGRGGGGGCLQLLQPALQLPVRLCSLPVLIRDLAQQGIWRCALAGMSKAEKTAASSNARIPRVAAALDPPVASAFMPGILYLVKRFSRGMADEPSWRGVAAGRTRPPLGSGMMPKYGAPCIITTSFASVDAACSGATLRAISAGTKAGPEVAALLTTGSGTCRKWRVPNLLRVSSISITIMVAFPTSDNPETSSARSACGQHPSHAYNPAPDAAPSRRLKPSSASRERRHRQPLVYRCVGLTWYPRTFDTCDLKNASAALDAIVLACANAEGGR